MNSLLITGAEVITATGRGYYDVLIEAEKIAALIEPHSDILAGYTGQSIDAQGKYLIPGGIDAHTHLEMPFGGTESSDNFDTGTRAAAWGGTTTIIDFAIQKQGERVFDGLSAWHDKASGQCHIDYAFHQIIGDINPQSLKDIRKLPEQGVTSFKLFMAYPGIFYSTDAQILEAMQIAAETGLLTMMHAENGPVIDVLAKQLVNAGKTAPYYHGIARAWQLEEEATHRAIMLANLTEAPLYIVHVSAKQAVQQIATARDLGMQVFSETCPQYLYLSLEEELGAPGFEGAKWVCSTPLRSHQEGHQASLWNALLTNDVQLVSTDHCPFCMNEQKTLGLNDFRLIPNGIGSIEHRMDLLYQGVVNGKLSLERWVEICSTAPARIFGLSHRKGIITPGADADLVIYDPQGTTTIGLPVDVAGNPTGRSHHMNMDYSAWEGFIVNGKVDTVLCRGKIIISHNQYQGRKGHGQYIPRGLCELAQ